MLSCSRSIAMIDTNEKCDHKHRASYLAVSQFLQYLESRITVVEGFRLEYLLIISFKEIYGVISPDFFVHNITYPKGRESVLYNLGSGSFI
jgi:hypothetical protein